MESDAGLRRRRRDSSRSDDAVRRDGMNGVESKESAAVKSSKDEDVSSRAVQGTVVQSARPAIFCSLLLIFASYAAVRLRQYLLADGGLWKARVRGADIKPPMSLFDPSLAMKHIEKIAQKPRWIGSNALDDSLDYIQKEVESLQKVALQNGMLLEVELFHASGSYAPSLASYNLVVSYGDVPSVVARLSPVSYQRIGSQPDSLLVGAHVDSAAGSPGGTDNVAAVGFAMEALRCITETPSTVDRITRPIVFLFNGAEEVILAGAHGFMTTHKWAERIAVHVNLESMGSGDAYVLFQVGPLNSWLAKVYARAVAAPLATTAGMDLFESKLIPAETDFRVFKEFGVPGFDFAAVDNGCVYHTKYDDVKHVSLKGVRYGGQTMLLPLVMELAGSRDAIGAHLREGSGSQQNSYAVYLKTAVRRLAGALPRLKYNQLSTGDQRATFFDILGLATVVFDENLSVVLNWAIVWLSLFLWSCRETEMDSTGTVSCSYGRVRMLLSLLVSAFAAFASATCAAVLYEHFLERPLSWYGSSRFAALLFGPSILVGCILAAQLTVPKNLSPKFAFDAMLFAVSMFYAGIVVAFTFLGLMTAFLPATVLVACMLASSESMKKYSLVARTTIVLFTSAVFGSVASYDALRTVIGLSGRIGDGPAEIIVSAVIAFLFVLYFWLPLAPIYVCRPFALPRLRFIYLLIAAFMSWVVWILPELTLPHRSAVYSKDAPKRVLAVHFHSPHQSPPDVLGLFALDLVPLDVNTTVRLLPFTDKDTLSELPVWGNLNSTLLESSRLFQKFLGNRAVFAVNERVDLAVPEVQVLDEGDVSVGGEELVNVTVNIKAPDSFQISTRLRGQEQGGPVRSWSLEADIVDMGDGQGCWMRHIGGGQSAHQLQITVTVEKDPATGRRRPLLMDITSTRLGKSRSRILQDLYFPLWAAPVYMQSTGYTVAV